MRFLISIYMLSASLLYAQQKVADPVVSLQPDSPVIHKLSGSDPVYPPIAKAAHVSGAVILHIVIQPDGSVSPAGVVSGPPTLVKAAQDAVKQWKYAPVMRDGHAITVATTATVNFK